MEFLKTFIEPLPNINNNFYRNIQFVENIFIAELNWCNLFVIKA